MKHLKTIFACLVMLFFTIGQVWAADTNTPTSGSQYRLKAVKTGTGAGTYYMVAPTSSGLGGATTTEADGTVFTFTQESSKWYVTFTNNSTTYYMYEHKDNGKVNISTTKTEVAIGTNGDYVKIGSSKWIQFNYNSGSPRVGAYSSSQTGVVLSEVAASSKPTLSLTPADTLNFGTVYKGGEIEAKTLNVKGANLTKGLKLLAPAGYTLSTDTVTKAEAEANTGKNITVTPPATSTVGTYAGNITVGGAFSDFGGEKDSVVVVSMKVCEVWTPDGENHNFGTILQYGDKPDPYTFTLKGSQLKPGSELIIRNTSGTDYYDFTPDYVVVDENGSVDQQITISLKYTDNVPATMTNNVVVVSNGSVDPVDVILFTVTTTVTGRYTIEATTDEHGNTFTWTDAESNENPQYGIPGTTVITATPKPAVGYVFTADSWDIYYKLDEDTKITHEGGVFTMQSYNTVISGTFEVSSTPEIAVSETELDFGTVDINSDPVDKTFKITGANLTSDVTVALGNWNSAFTLSEGVFDKDDVMAEGGVTVTISSNPTYAGENITNKAYIYWQGTQKEVALKMTVNKLAAGLAWGEAEKTGVIGEAYSHPTLTNPHSLAISYSSSDPTKATIDAESGEVTLLAEGSTTIKATTEGNGTYAAQEVSYTLNVQKKKTVEWWINGVKKGEQTASAGTELTGIPDATLASNGAIYGKVFKGWAEAAIEGEVAEGAAGIVATPTVMPNEDKKYYAVYATEVPGAESYKLVNSLTVGKKYIFASSNAAGSAYALPAKDMVTSSATSVVGVAVTISTVSDVSTIATLNADLEYLYEKVNLGGGDTLSLKVVADNTANYLCVNGSGLNKRTSGYKVFWNSGLYGTNSGGGTKYYVEYKSSDHTFNKGSSSTSYPVYAYERTAGASSYSKYATSGPKLLDDPTFSPVAGTYTEAKSVAISAGEGETIYYTINGEDPTTSSDEYTTAISLSKYGEYTIKAIAAKEDGSKSNVASATYKINVPFASVAELLAYVESKTPFGTISVTGIVSEIVTEYSTEHSNITFNISDDGQTTSDQFQSFRGVGEDANKVGVGDKVTITGTYTVYGSTKELAQGNVISDRIAAAVTSVEISGDADTKAYESGEAFAFTGLAATAVYNTGYEKDVTDEDDVWAANPATIGASTESVSVTATYDEVASTPKVVTGITVNKHAVTFSAPTTGTLVVKKNNGEEWVAITSGDTFVKGTTLKVEATPVSDDYKLTALTAGGADIFEAGQFTVGTENITVVATISEKAEAPISWSRATVTAYTVAKDWMSALFSNEQGLTVTFTSTATDVATVDANGEATPLKTGETTIKAIFAGNNDYKAKTVSYTMNVYEPVSIALGGSLTKTEYESGEEFDRSGLTATLKYADDETADITGIAEWLIDGHESAIVYNDAQFSVQAGYGEIADSEVFDVTVNTHKVTFTTGNFVVKNGGVAITSNAEFVKGTVLTVEAAAGYKLTALTVNEVDILEAKQFTIGTEDVAIAATTEALPIKFYVAGDFTNWGTDKEPSYEDSYTIKNLAAGDHMMKIVDGENWYGYDKLSAKTGEFTRGSGTDDNNIKFTLAEDGDIVVTYTGEVFTVTGNFLMPTVYVAGSMTNWDTNKVLLTPAEDKLTASETINLTKNYYEFKMVVDGHWLAKSTTYGLNRGHNSVESVDQEIAEGPNITLTPDVAGDYTFTWEYATKKLTVTFPAEPANEYYIAGTFTNWKTNMVKMTENLGAFETTITINSTLDQEFQVVRVHGLDSTWYGLASAATMTSDNCENWIIGGGSTNIGLEPTKDGDYKFVFVPAELKLTLTMPAKSGTALDNTADETKAVKFLENGQIFILRGEKVYTVDGQLVK